MALTDAKVRSAKSQERDYTLVDGDGMFLLIHPNGSKYWRFHFRFGGKQHLMAFGVYPETSLADARQKRGPEGLLLQESILASINVL
ncbi:Prophage CP4-57 integrase [Serratia marcescens]|nr:Prophage CP4-57 integrase [Serratia marcescens]